ncbi:30S ribosomal protein S3 [bacterium]|nr:30S ribosomal protein S3 [bacterium]MBQ3368482.1 30S ribosomal protein S3 [bacterium]MBQ4439123.1 30S ribosomal protein S3 [bacterium]MBR4530962.1 30S ribosomal protein S3 [bacterium]MBR6421782.1 30S ribosomal protein S3 [bacterium]
MGQKVNPIGLRLGVTRTWESVWYSHKNYSKWLHEDLKIRKAVKKEFYSAGIARTDIERSGERLKIIIHTAKPGIVVGRKGVGIEKIKEMVLKIAQGATDVFVQTEEVKKPEIDAQLVSESIAEQLERRAHFRKAMKRAIGQAMKSGAEGIKVQTSGRLGGAEIARTERYQEGRTPLHTLRANIDYGFATAKTSYGVIGVKVWLSKGDFAERKSEPRRRQQKNK